MRDLPETRVSLFEYVARNLLVRVPLVCVPVKVPHRIPLIDLCQELAGLSRFTKNAETGLRVANVLARVGVHPYEPGGKQGGNDARDEPDGAELIRKVYCKLKRQVVKRSPNYKRFTALM